MALFRRGKKDESKALLAEIVATMRPVPEDELLTCHFTLDVQQLLEWVSFKETKSLIDFDEAPQPRKK